MGSMYGLQPLHVVFRNGADGLLSAVGVSRGIPIESSELGESALDRSVGP